MQKIQTLYFPLSIRAQYCGFDNQFVDCKTLRSWQLESMATRLFFALVSERNLYFYVK